MGIEVTRLEFLTRREVMKHQLMAFALVVFTAMPMSLQAQSYGSYEEETIKQGIKDAKQLKKAYTRLRRYKRQLEREVKKGDGANRTKMAELEGKIEDHTSLVLELKAKTSGTPQFNPVDEEFEEGTYTEDIETGMGVDLSVYEGILLDEETGECVVPDEVLMSFNIPMTMESIKEGLNDEFSGIVNQEQICKMYKADLEAFNAELEEGFYTETEFDVLPEDYEGPTKEDILANLSINAAGMCVRSNKEETDEMIAQYNEALQREEEEAYTVQDFCDMLRESSEDTLVSLEDFYAFLSINEKGNCEVSNYSEVEKLLAKYNEQMAEIGEEAVEIKEICELFKADSDYEVADDLEEEVDVVLDEEETDLTALEQAYCKQQDQIQDLTEQLETATNSLVQVTTAYQESMAMMMGMMKFFSFVGNTVTNPSSYDMSAANNAYLQGIIAGQHTASLSSLINPVLPVINFNSIMNGNVYNTLYGVQPSTPFSYNFNQGVTDTNRFGNTSSWSNIVRNPALNTNAETEVEEEVEADEEEEIADIE
jgi:hypothetical protein